MIILIKSGHAGAEAEVEEIPMEREAAREGEGEGKEWWERIEFDSLPPLFTFSRLLFKFLFFVS